MAAIDGVLGTVREERGYTLSYHEIFARTEPDMLKAYADFYRTITLQRRYLGSREREIVWTGILVSEQERIGSIHIERALEAGLSVSEIADAIAVAAIAQGFSRLAFAYDSWGHLVDVDVLRRYKAQLFSAAPALNEQEIHLSGLATQCTLLNGVAFDYHLESLYDLDVSERSIAEAISYLFLPKGANAVVWATDRWLEAIADERVVAGEALSGVNVVTRRS